MKEYRTYAGIRRDLEDGHLTVSELVESYLEKIRAGSQLNAFIETFEDEAREHARNVQKKIRQGTAGSLAGLVLGIKDNLCYKDHHVTAGSRILGGFKSLFTATSIQRLIDQDAIIIGRLNCDEFAMGSSNETSFYGPVANPLDPSRVPGGSSGGSAAALAAGMCHATLGSDTGGSIRQPAAFCGIVGTKPTYGRVSRSGLLAFASSFDQIGPFTWSVQDAALLTAVMSGKDPLDNTTSSLPPSNPQVRPVAKKYRIGIIRETIEMDGLDPEIRAGIHQMLERLRADGHEIVDLSFPYLAHVIPTYYVLATAEASSNLSRYDGIRFGYRSNEAGDIEDVYRRSRTEGFGKEVKRRIMLGTFVLSAGFYDAYYTRAMRVRRLIREHTREVFHTCDIMLSPTAPTVAFRPGEKTDDPIAMYLSDIYTVHANLSGNPAISLPMSGHSSGMPWGLHLMAPEFDEDLLFSVSSMIETLALTPTSS